MYQYHSNREHDFWVITPEDAEACRLLNIKKPEDQYLQALALDLIQNLRNKFAKEVQS